MDMIYQKIRQLLFGKRFMQKEFGMDSKILWLPDVFGYSGVPRFFTTKMQWSETNKIPHDNFIWEGIDGTSVFSIFNTGYVKKCVPLMFITFGMILRTRKSAILQYHLRLR